MATYRSIRLTDLVAGEIRVWLARRGMTARELARRLQVSPSWISYRLNSTQAIDLNDLESIAAELDVTPADLMGLDLGTVPERLRKVVTYLNDEQVADENKDLLLRIIDRGLLTVSTMPEPPTSKRRSVSASR
jgi:transcriptional regulator with XRE-family HTH domain